LVAFNKEHLPKNLQEELIPLPNAFPALSGTFSHFLGRLELCLVKYRSSLSVMGYGAREEQPRPTGMSEAALAELSMNLSLGTRDLEKAAWVPEFHQAPDFTKPDVQAIREFYWYVTMVGPKFRRALKGRTEEGGTGSNGRRTARLTHLVLARAVVAMTVLIEQHGQPAYQDLRTLLEDTLRLLAGIRALFPDAYRYPRPGFDDPAERAFLKKFYGGHPPVDPFEDGTWSPGGRAPEV
jgi:hypothetical protein